ncbi:767_t:CDS:1 [Acaulospora morrowiae]|uniref:767_t:CDS:1 n=1 Tax=Acaulospora morrowiae TaxID=94023 RepID=A0A9N9D4Q1_9GLOM|nr:767_t:CDS:1 [Acaulospora morrowiae]
MIFKIEQSKSATKNRRVNSIGEANIDAERRRRVLRLRRSLTYPYDTTDSFGQSKSGINRRCDRCAMNNGYVNLLSVRINHIEELVENLSKIVTSKSYNKNTSHDSEAVDFSKMGVDELISFSNKLSTSLFGNNSITKEPEDEVASKVNNRMDINAIINNRDN